MPVYLSPVGGAAAQFFDDNGAPLNGGKLYTYAAGTTTAQTTYTTNIGDIPHTNPIILNAGGRVPSGGEIWLSFSPYKFVLKTSDDVLIATYDNITGFGSVSDTAQNFTGDGVTTAFTLAIAPSEPTALLVILNGLVLKYTSDYSISGATLTFVSAPALNDEIVVR